MCGLLKEPESLCAQVLKARYYPDGNLLNVKMKSGCSYTWQSILAGLKCFRLGYIWRIGDGTQINIWEDSWIPGNHNLKVHTRRGNNLIKTVDELINPVTISWDEDLVRSILPIDANRILQIPITAGREDCIAWHYNRNGLFSVKSAYHCQWKEKFGTKVTALQGNGTSNRRVWKSLWKLEVPAKIKIFGWRALRGLMPCNAILANRHIIPDGGCPVCHKGAEDIKHLLFTCDRSIAMWRAMGIEEKIRSLVQADRSGSIVLEEAICRGEQIQDLGLGLAELILTGGWYLWWERRQQTHGETVQPPPRSAIAIVCLAKNYKLSMKKSAQLKQGWKRPPEDYIMLNIDASFNEDEGHGSTGAIIRDSKGGMIAAANSFKPYIVDAPMAEALALKEGLLLAQHIGGNKLIVQTDCMEVVEIMKDGGFTANVGAAIYDECSMMWHGFQEISIEHLSREANQVAHELARLASYSKSDCIWDDDPPLSIVQLLANDVTIFDQ